jgi:hypothetical protein
MSMKFFFCAVDELADRDLAGELEAAHLSDAVMEAHRRGAMEAGHPRVRVLSIVELPETGLRGPLIAALISGGSRHAEIIQERKAAG